MALVRRVRPDIVITQDPHHANSHFRVELVDDAGYEERRLYANLGMSPSHYHLYEIEF